MAHNDFSAAKTIFITGATSGFGAATARLFAQNGWKVVGTGRREDRLKALQNEFPEGQIHIVQMDLTDEASIKAGVDALPESHSTVDCLFNNGGLALGVDKVPNVSREQWRTMVETNIMGVLDVTLNVLPHLKKAGKGAAIINVGSIAGSFAYPGGNVYGATKAFTHQFSYNLRCDLAGSDIRVTSLEPGMAKSEFTLVRTGSEEANEKLYEDVLPLVPQDIAEIVWFLATRPAHVNINCVEVMPVAQTPATPQIHRG
jgi:NADP-dependent 3-hydroxy acid dehydrogenase YdfG